MHPFWCGRPSNVDNPSNKYKYKYKYKYLLTVSVIQNIHTKVQRNQNNKYLSSQRQPILRLSSNTYKEILNE